ncbi:MAG TPA: TauD/TfdA family dioxygenase [Acidimicrobiales bacterium]|jgi:taurine dioxygenase|nr:TauD/TfdA family dioxygenase [Acidimicrobiales bacterium]
MTDVLDTAAPAGITVTPLSGHIGAQIDGIDISRPLSPEALTTIQDSLNRWKVVFFRDQDLDHGAQIAFGRQFGELTYAHPHDDTPPDGYPEIYTVDPRRFNEQYGISDEEARRIRKYSYTNGWHTDVTPAVNPPAGSILRADVVPAFGGDTTFTNLVAAYGSLSDGVKQLLDGLRAEHFYGAGGNRLSKVSTFGNKIEKNRLVAHHPVVRVHPVTGEKGLFVNPVFTDHIVDVSPLESRWILDFLYAHLARNEFTVRFKWEPGSVAFWDNRATAHLGPQDLGHVDVDRVLHRVTLIGDVPVGPDGFESQLIEGVPFRSAPVFGN